MNLVTVESIWRPESQQRIYRCLLDAMSYPGHVFDLAAELGAPDQHITAEMGVLACLVDDIVAFADPDGRLDARMRKMLNAPCIAPELADYVLHDATRSPLPGYEPRLGDLYRPDSAATLILSGKNVGQGDLSLNLEGPGIPHQTLLQLDGFDSRWFEARAVWCDNFPLGVDLFLCDRTHVAALPRTTRVKVER